jgi:hypothetical protein
VVLEGTNNCTACYNGCASCHTSDPSLCLSCSDADYVDNSSICQPCPTYCQRCTTATLCSTCYPGYILLSDGVCYNYIGYPCLQQIGNTCVACYTGYKLNKTNNCVISITCNSNSSCLSCPVGYYLKNKICNACKTNSLCAFCSPSKPAQCLTCISGYYLDTTMNCYTCGSSMQGCLNCTSGWNCTHVDNGYYISIDVNGYPTGNILPCPASCATCISPTCLTCATGYTRFGGFCLYEQYVSGTITLGPGPGTNWFSSTQSSQQNLAYALSNSGQIISALLALSGLSASQFSSILLKGITGGSVVV